MYRAFLWPSAKGTKLIRRLHQQAFFCLADGFFYPLTALCPDIWMIIKYAAKMKKAVKGCEVGAWRVRRDMTARHVAPRGNIGPAFCSFLLPIDIKIRTCQAKRQKEGGGIC